MSGASHTSRWIAKWHTHTRTEWESACASVCVCVHVGVRVRGCMRLSQWDALALPSNAPLLFLPLHRKAEPVTPWAPSTPPRVRCCVDCSRYRRLTEEWNNMKRKTKKERARGNGKKKEMEKIK